MKFLVILLTLVTTNTFALNSTMTKSQADKLSLEFAKTGVSKSNNFNYPNCQNQDQISCLKAVCNYSNDCTFDSDIKEIAQACRGVSGDCVDVICAKTGDCTFKSKALEVAASCRASNGVCTRIGCEKTNDCVFASNAKEIAQACVGVNDGDCVAFACEKSGSCIFRSNFILIAKSCAGY